MKNLFVIFTTLILTACAVPVEYKSTGGSKSDGIVKLSYQHGSAQIPQTDEAQGLKKAEEVCKRWGYKSAFAFDAGVKECVSYYNGCNVYRVTKEYQCEG